MKQVALKYSVEQATKKIKEILQDKKFILFNDIDHQANASKVDLKMPASRVLIFGNPVAGTKLMQDDISISFDLPLRVAIVEKEGLGVLIYNNVEDYSSTYNVKNVQILNNINALFEEIVSKLS